MTRFGEIPPVKQIFKNIWQYIYGLFGFGLLTHFGTIRMLLGKFSLLQMAKYWKHNLVIWSHWSTRWTLFENSRILWATLQKWILKKTSSRRRWPDLNKEGQRPRRRPQPRTILKRAEFSERENEPNVFWSILYLQKVVVLCCCFLGIFKLKS